MANIKEFFVKLVNFSNQRTDSAKSRFFASESVEHQLAKEREAAARQRMHEQKWEEVQVPTEAVVTGPSESTPEKKD